MPLQELAAAWVRTNCPRPDVRASFLQNLDHALKLGVSCSFTIGCKLTKTRQPWLVYCFEGEFFAFEITAEQAARLKIADMGLLCAESRRREERLPEAEPIVWLEEVIVDQAAELDRTKKVTGTIRYRTERPLFDLLAIRVVGEAPGRSSRTHFDYVRCLPPQGTVKFSIDALGDLHDRAKHSFAGTMPLFFQIWTTKPDSEATSPFGPSWPNANNPKVPQPGMLPGWPPKAPPLPTSHMPGMPGHNPFPHPLIPGFDDPTQPVQPPKEHPISDIRAVLVEVV